MTPYPLIDCVIWGILGYFLVSNCACLLLNTLSVASMRSIEQRNMLADAPCIYSGLEPPVSVLLATRDEEISIVASVHSLLQLSYSTFEIIVINDGSQDATIDVLTAAFDLLPFPEAYRIQLSTHPVTRIYRSTRYPNLRVLDKERGGTADALNAGINAAHYPLFCPIDSHMILQRDSLNSLVAPFLSDAGVIAATAAARVANECETKGGFLHKVNLPNRLLPLFQIIEHLRTSLFASLGWATLNAMLIAPDGVSLLRKDATIEAGGYRTDALDAGMELIIRMHRTMRRKRQPYQIRFVADAACWRKVPVDLSTLRAKSMHRQQSLLDSLSQNRGLLLSRNGGIPGTIAFPFFLLLEVMGPVIESLGYVFIAIAFACGIIPWQTCAAFLSVAIGLGILLSVSSLMLEEMMFHLYPKAGDIGRLILVAVIENFGYRQLNAGWRTLGLLDCFLPHKNRSHAAGNGQTENHSGSDQ